MHGIHNAATVSRAFEMFTAAAIAPCTSCSTAAADLPGNLPLHVVHPETAEPHTCNAWGLAVCPTCGGGWYRGHGGRCTLLGVAGPAAAARDE